MPRAAPVTIATGLIARCRPPTSALPWQWSWHWRFVRLRYAEAANEAPRDQEVRRAEIPYRGVPEAEQRRVDVAAEDVEHILNTGLAGVCEPPQVGTPDHHRP